MSELCHRGRRMWVEDGVAVFFFLHISSCTHRNQGVGYRSYLQSGRVDLDFFALERDDCCDFSTVVDSGASLDSHANIHLNIRYT